MEWRYTPGLVLCPLNCKERQQTFVTTDAVEFTKPPAQSYLIRMVLFVQCSCNAVRGIHFVPRRLEQPCDRKVDVAGSNTSWNGVLVLTQKCVYGLLMLWPLRSSSA